MARPRSDIRPRILEAAAERFLHDGVDGASMRQIAHDARTSLGMITYYFASKDDLFVAVVEDAYRRMLDEVAAALTPEAPFEVQVERLYARVARFDDDEVRVIRLVLREAMLASPRMPALMARFSEGHIPLVLQSVLTAMVRNEARSDLHPLALMASIFGGALLPQLFRRLVGPMMPAHLALPEADALATMMRRVLFEGIAAPHDRASAREGG